MKTSVLIAMTILLFSCKKDYTCICETMTLEPVTIAEFIIKNKTRKQAKKECLESEPPYNGIGCRLK